MKQTNSNYKTTDFKQKEEVNEISLLKGGEFFKGIVKVLRKIKPGPVILGVSDGYSSIDAVTKNCDFKVGDVVELSGDVNEHSGKLQVEIRSINVSNKDFDSIIDEKSNPELRDLSIKSEKLELLKPGLTKIAKRIRKAIIENQPILIRHHADADGIMSGIAIEKACEQLMLKLGLEPQYLLYRSPSKAPFYEIKDMLKDIGFTKRVLEGHDQKKPLILVLDNGSTPEDVFAMKSLKLLGFDIVVLDHHNPVVLENNKTAVCPFVQLHVNPYMYGLNGKISAGMICYETARLISKDFDMPVLPAISAIGDRCDNEEQEEYIKNSKYDIKKLKKLVIAIDFLAYHFKFDSGRGVFEILFEKEEFVDMINAEVSTGVETQLQSTLPYLRTQEIKGVVFSHIDLEKYTLRFTYPTPGKIIGLIHDEVAQGKESSPVITLGCLSDMIILRATQPVLPIANILEKLQKDLPEANVDGGGHECAGTIKFVSAHFNAILENIKQQIRDLEYLDKKEQTEL